MKTNRHAADWTLFGGQIVEVQGFSGDLYRRGVVEHVMPDSSGVWLAADGAYTREFIDQASGYTIWTTRAPHP